MLARRSAENFLQIMTGQAATFTSASPFVALLTTAPTDDNGTGLVEVSGGGYGRVQATFAAPSTTTDPTTVSNSVAVQFNAATANWTPSNGVVAFALYDSGTSGNLLAWDWLGNYAWQPFTVNSASPAVFTIGQSAPVSGSAVVISSTLFGGTAPTYSAGSPGANTVLNVNNVSGDTFQLQNGATTLATSAAGSGMVRQITGTGASPGQQINSGVQPSFAVGTLVISLV
jgi:hypothetical protein